MFQSGLALGFVLSSFLHWLSFRFYKNVLKTKAEDGTAECIDGEFYYIKKEGDR